MTILSAKTGETKIEAKFRVSATSHNQVLLDAPGGLYPLRHSAWAMDEYRIGNGWPQPVPPCDVNAKVSISAEGDVLADREDARAIETAANARWIADDELWDEDIFRWYPVQTDAPVFFEGFSGDNPSLDLEYEYRIKNEVFLQPGLTFDTDVATYLNGSLGQMIGGTYAYTVIMVVSLNTPDSRLDSAGLWCPGDTSVGWVNLSLSGNWLYLATDQSENKPVLAIADLLGTSQPMMLALVMGRPYASVYAAVGPSAMSMGKTTTGTEFVAMSPEIVLGRSDAEHSVDMTLLDLGVYNQALTAAEVRTEFATLSAAYGGDK